MLRIINRFSRVCQRVVVHPNTQQLQTPNPITCSVPASVGQASYQLRAYSLVTPQPDGVAESKAPVEPEASLDPVRERKLKILQLEVSVMRQEGRRVPDPDLLKPDQWEHLLSLASKSARTKYYSFLWTIERKKEHEKARKEKKREDGVALREEKIKQLNSSEHIVYSLSHTSYFLRIYESAMNHWHNNKLTRAMQFGQKLVLDCSYDEHMTRRECINAAKQLMFCFAENRYHDQPFDLHFCNANLKGDTMTYLKKHIPTMLEPHFPMNVHECSYLDVFPKDQLVYLTPHCNNDLTEYNPDHTYIVGAMVDTMNNEPLSLAKAKKLGLKMARLPLDRYLQWGSGSGKSLTLNQMTHIMLDLKTTGDWNKSLMHVPRRKLVLDSNDGQSERRKWEKSLDSFRVGGGYAKGKVTVRRNPPKYDRNHTAAEVEEFPVEDTTGPRVNKFRRKPNDGQ